MEEDVGMLRREIEELQEENGVLKAQVEAANANAEHAAQGMETRYNALVNQQGKLAGEKDKLASANEKLQEELLAAKQELNNLSAKLVEMDTVLERKSKEFDAERSMKVALDRAAERREADMRELELKLKKAQDKVLQLTEENNMTEARAQEAQSKADDASRVEHDLKSKLSQQTEITEALEAENKSLRERYQSKRLELDNKVLELSANLDRVTRECESVKKDLERERADNTNLQEKLQERNKRIKDLQDEAYERERDFKLQTRLKDDLIKTLQEQNQSLDAKRTELSGMVKEFNEAMMNMTASSQEALRLVEAERDSLKEQVAEQEQQRRRLLEAAASGQLPLIDVADGPLEGSPTVPGDAANWSKTELYSRYIDAMAKAREDRCTIRQFEIIMQQVQSEVEKKAVLVKEQRAEHVRLVESHETMSITVENLTRERRELQTHMAVLESEARRAERERRMLEQSNMDLRKQIVALLEEVERRTGGRSSAPPGQALQLTAPGQTITTADVVTDRLVTFHNIEELQDINGKQLRVIRELSEQAEADKDELRKECEARSAAELARISAQLEDLKRERTELEEICSKVMRQRDLYRELLQEANGDFAVAAALPGAAAAGIVPRPSAHGTLATANGSATGPNWQKLHEDLENEKEAALKDAANSMKKLGDELRDANQQVAQLRAQSDMNKSLSEFHKREMDRYEEMWKAANRDMQNLHHEMSNAQNNAAKSDEFAREERRKLDLLKEQMTELKTERATLDADLKLTRAQLEREQGKAEQALREKFGLDASRKTEAERYKLLEERQAETIAGLEARLKAAVEDLEESEARCSQMGRTAEQLAAARDAAGKLAVVRVPELEEQLRQLTQKLEEATYRAASAEGKVEVLQTAIANAEERATALEMQARAQPVGSADDAGAASSAEQAAEMELLKEEVLKHRDTVAALSGTVAQYKALAASAEEAHKGTQNEHAKYKAEAEQRAVQDKAEIQKLEDELALLHHKLESKSQVIADLEGRLDAAFRAHAREVTAVRATVEKITAERDNLSRHNNRLGQEVREKDFHLNDWKSKFETQTAALNDIIAEKTRLAQDLQQTRVLVGIKQKTLDDANDKLATKERVHQEQVMRLEDELKLAKHKLSDAEKELELLHKQLKDFADAEKAKTDGPLSGNVELAELVQHMRSEKEVLKGQLAVEKSERTTLEKKLLIRERELALTRQDLEVATREERARVLQEEEFKANQKLTVDNANLREANKNLRQARDNLEMRIKNLEGTYNARMEEMKSLRMRIPRLEADVQASKEQAEKATKEAMDWAAKTRELMTKKIDLAEHEKALNQLKEAQAKVAQLEKGRQDAVDQTKVLEDRSKLLEEEKSQLCKRNAYLNAVMRQINPEKLAGNVFTSRVEEKNKRLQELEGSVQGLQQVINQLHKDLAVKVSSIKTLETDLKSMQANRENVVSQLTKERTALTLEKTKLEAQVGSLKKERTTLEAELKAAKQAAAAAAASAATAPPPAAAAPTAPPGITRHSLIPPPRLGAPAGEGDVSTGPPADALRKPRPTPIPATLPPRQAVNIPVTLPPPATTVPPPAATPTTAAPTQAPAVSKPVPVAPPAVSVPPVVAPAASVPVVGLPTMTLPMDPDAIRRQLLAKISQGAVPLSPPRAAPEPAPAPVAPGPEQPPAAAEAAEAPAVKREAEAPPEEPLAKRVRVEGGDVADRPAAGSETVAAEPAADTAAAGGEAEGAQDAQQGGDELTQLAEEEEDGVEEAGEGEEGEEQPDEEMDFEEDAPDAPAGQPELQGVAEQEDPPVFFSAEFHEAPPTGVPGQPDHAPEGNAGAPQAPPDAVGAGETPAQSTQPLVTAPAQSSVPTPAPTEQPPPATAQPPLSPSRGSGEGGDGAKKRPAIQWQAPVSSTATPPVPPKRAPVPVPVPMPGGRGVGTPVAGQGTSGAATPGAGRGTPGSARGTPGSVRGTSSVRGTPGRVRGRTGRGVKRPAPDAGT